MADELLLRHQAELYARLLADLEEGERHSRVPTDVIANKLWVQRELAALATMLADEADPE